MKKQHMQLCIHVSSRLVSSIEIQAVWSAGVGLSPRELRDDPESLHTRVFGLTLRNPLGLAAGFDKDGECYAAMHAMGFGFVEVGSVTPLPQPGNDKPRVFRLREHEAVINRYGFNSEGASAVARRMRANEEAGTRRDGFVLGVNVGKNKVRGDVRITSAAINFPRLV